MNDLARLKSCYCELGEIFCKWEDKLPKENIILTEYDEKLDMAGLIHRALDYLEVAIDVLEDPESK